MQEFNFNLIQSWRDILKTELEKEYISNLKLFLLKEQSKHTIYPSKTDIFNAYNSTIFSDVKVVILGQDPYHGLNQAHGLCFSVANSVTSPPSLKNIFKELVDDTECSYPTNSNLQSWANQGVLLINTVLTVRAHEANSHKNKGWESFTDASIKAVSDKLNNVVFILWGGPAQKKEKLIDSTKHLILKAPHPSPLSSYRGFFGSKPFSKTNNYLANHNKEPIDWCLS
jgi:uracil-DNA glycosylase